MKLIVFFPNGTKLRPEIEQRFSNRGRRGAEIDPTETPPALAEISEVQNDQVAVATLWRTDYILSTMKVIICYAML